MYRNGFTLLEVLLVVAMLGVLISLNLFFLDSDKQFSRINNEKRRSDVFSIYNAINQYRSDNRGDLPVGIGTSNMDICQPGCLENSTQIDISDELKPYIRYETLPIDPEQSGTTITGYKIKVDGNNRVVVSAPLAGNDSINTSE